MKKKVSLYTAVLAASTNLIASGLLAYALDKRQVYETQSAAIAAHTVGTWLFVLSAVLWLIFVVSRLVGKQK